MGLLSARLLLCPCTSLWRHVKIVIMVVIAVFSRIWPCYTATPAKISFYSLLSLLVSHVTVLKKKRVSSAFDSPDNEDGLTQDPSDDDFAGAEDPGPKKRRPSVAKKRNSTVPASPLAGVGGA